MHTAQRRNQEQRQEKVIERNESAVFKKNRIKQCRRKRCFTLLLSVLLLYGNLFYGKAAEEELELYARSAVLMDGSSGRILYAKEADTPLPMASTTKIMTCIIALEKEQENAICSVSEYAASQPQVRLGMKKGQKFYLKDLFYSLMLESHNDTAVCIAEHIAGSVEAFADEMNAKAQEIGCSDTYYISPNGLDEEDAEGIHHTTAEDLALVLRYCITESPKARQFLEITETMQYTFTDTEGVNRYSCINHNAFLQMMDGALTGKTGFTAKAGYCYAGAVEKEEHLLIVSLLACGWPGHRSWKWADMRRLVNYGMEHYEIHTLEGMMQMIPVPVKNGQTAYVAVEEEKKSCRILLGNEEKVTRWVEVPKMLAAPIKKGAVIGSVQYQIDGFPVLVCPVRTREGVEEKNFRYELEKAVEDFLL